MVKARKSHKKNMRKSKKNMRKTKGGCGCNSSLNTAPVIKGGSGYSNPASFNGSLPIRYYYGQNDHVNDPIDPSVVDNARNFSTIFTTGGGKRARKGTRKNRRKRNKKMTGGDLLLGSAYSNNPLMTFGTVDGAANATNILYSNSSVNSSVYSQPTLSGFNSSNPPLA